ncbi:MAG TPA: SDR family NAD(P)-dependent oxidoreductase, partial [Kofleriaceae bacterium]|nr:SDR family NAD(P)-dependent oxidoreductase [Kofleriaceae bacterium]
RVSAGNVAAMDLTEQLVVVTGAGSGIGRATAHAFAARGARVVVCDVDRARTDAVAAELGRRCALAAQVDVGDRARMAAFAGEVHALAPAVDVLVNNAGVGYQGGVLRASLDDWDHVLRVNLMGVIHGVHFFAPAMVARGRGHVINVSSVLGYYAAPGLAPYVTSKFGVLGLTLAMRAELEQHGVRATAICPGMIATGIVDATRFATFDAANRARAAKEFRERGTKPEVVADAIVAVVGTGAAVRPVARDAWVGWAVARWAPRLIGDRLGRFAARRLARVDAGARPR